MEFNIEDSIKLLDRTPAVLKTLLENLPDKWTTENEGPNTWSVFDIIGHLVHGEKTDWIPRMEIILSDSLYKTFESFDRFAQFDNSKGKTLGQLLDEFQTVRGENTRILRARNISRNDLNKKGSHPELGEATLSQLLATWAVHDLNHLAQISRVMAKHYSEAVGPWIEYLSILHSKK